MRSVPSFRLLSATAALFLALSLAWAPAVFARDESAGGAADVTITIGSGLSDRDIRVGVGDVVRFVNRDGDRHRMRARSGPDEFDTGNLEPGEAFQVRFAIAGTYGYADDRDRDDAAYRGRIVVEAAGGSGDDGAGGAGGGGGGSAASSATVTIGDDFFQPTSVRVAVGGAVTFQNTGGDEHSATSSAFDSGALSGGASFRQAFDSAGTFDFLCMFHSDMRGTVEVVAAGAVTTPPEAPEPAPTVVPTSVPTAVPAPTASTAAVPAPTASTDPAGGGAPAEVTLDIVDLAFEPATIEVAAGGVVTWTNRGVAPHTVQGADSAFDSGILDAGASFQHTFATPGAYDYLCAVHPEMTATIRVVAATAATAESAAVASAEAATVAAGTVADSPTGEPAGSTSSSLAGIVLAVVLVSAAAALFSRAIRGTVRTPG